MLQSIQLNSSDFNNEIPIDLYSLLHANQNTDKLAVARQKILQNYSFENIEFVASSLPKVMSCVGNTDSQMNLSQLYGILRRVPHLVQKNQMKRKLHDL